jgi:hypothetical protein
MKTRILILFLAIAPLMLQAQLTYTTNNGAITITGYIGLAGNLTIPSTINGYPVTTIGEDALTGGGLASVTIPNSVTSIGEGAFWYSYNLTNVTIGNGVTTIGDEAFGDCFSLTSVVIGNSVTTIGEEAFLRCYDLTSVYFQGNAPTVDGGAGSADTTVFAYDPSGAVYYVPGTTGWGATFGGWPTVELDAPPQIGGGGGIGIQSGNFGFTITGVSNQTVVVEASTNLLNWQVIQTITLSGTSTNFTDTQWTNFPDRFYRAAYAYTVGGTLTGLPAGDTVTLQDNGSDNLTLNTNGTFTFPTALPNGHAYSVTISGTGGGTETTHTLMNGSGTISGANVTNVSVLCPPLYTGNFDVDMYNAAVADGTANGGVPAVMLTENGGPFRVTALGTYSYDVALRYQGLCKLAVIEGTTSCSSTTLPSPGPAIQFGSALVCGSGPYGY